MSVTENVLYKPCPENPDRTVAERRACFDSKIFGLGYAIQVREIYICFSLIQL